MREPTEGRCIEEACGLNSEPTPTSYGSADRSSLRSCRGLVQMPLESCDGFFFCLSFFDLFIPQYPKMCGWKSTEYFSCHDEYWDLGVAARKRWPMQRILSSLASFKMYSFNNLAESAVKINFIIHEFSTMGKHLSICLDLTYPKFDSLTAWIRWAWYS